jgi:hypothetical protein
MTRWVVGAMTPILGRACFDEATIITEVTPSHAPIVERFFQVGSNGEWYGESAWKALIADGQAMPFEYPFVEFQEGLACWIMRRSFPERNNALTELSVAGVLIGTNPDYGLDPTVWCLVRREPADIIRRSWLDKAVALAAYCCSTNYNWEGTLCAAIRAFNLAPELDASILGLLILSYERVGLFMRAEGYASVALRSKGQDFHAEVLKHKEAWARQARDGRDDQSRTDDTGQSDPDS